MIDEDIWGPMPYIGAPIGLSRHHKEELE